MAEVRVYLFGYPRVECGREAVVIPRRKAMALLAYLGATQSHHSRDSLASLLWPEEEPAKGYAFLRNALWVLHQTPLDPWILATRHMVGLRADGGLWVDVAEFRRLLRACQRHDHPASALCDEGVAALEAATELARDDFLSGFIAEDTRTFEEWQYSEADALGQEAAAALERLSAHLQASGNPAGALHHAQRLLARRPLDEAAHRRVMTLQAETGDRAAALRTYDECVRALDRELSLPPSDETRALADRLKIRAPAAAKPRTAPPRATLPTFRFPLLGREDAVVDILRLLSDESCRLVTLTGAGGSGKTRLAVEIAGRAERFEEGAVFVPLVDVETPDLVPAAILHALGEVVDTRTVAATDSSEPRSFRDVAHHLTDRQLLVVLDNAEHLARDPRWLATLLRSTRDPSFLVTSRQELAVPGELVYPLEGLQFPRARTTDSPTQFPAVQLFVQAARRADSRFAPSPDDVRAVAVITRYLGGSPLAIELAASWVRTLSCSAIEAEILRSVDFLKTDRKLVARRHRSLRAAFEGSWSLLDRDARAAFRALSVFRGGFTPAGALRVAGVSLPALSGLVAKSLLERVPPDRYDMLEVVRQYASERLLAVGDEAGRLLDRHAEHFLALLVSQETRLKGPEQVKAIALLEPEEANLAAAWRHAAGAGRTEDLARAAMGLFLFCDMTSRFASGRELFRLAATAETRRGREAVRRRAYLRGLEAWFCGFVDPYAARDLFREATGGIAKLPLDRDLAFIRVLAAFSTHRVGTPLDAEVTPALEYFEAHGCRWEAGAAYEALVNTRGDVAGSLDVARRSIAIRQDIGDHWGVALGRYTEALILQEMGHLDEAAKEFTASAELRKEIGLDLAGRATCYAQLGRINSQLGRTAEARRDLEQAYDIAKQVGYALVAAVTLDYRASLEAAARRPGVARRYAEEAAETYAAAGFPDRAAAVRKRHAKSPAAGDGAG